MEGDCLARRATCTAATTNNAVVAWTGTGGKTAENTEVVVEDVDGDGSNDYTVCPEGFEAVIITEGGDILFMTGGDLVDGFTFGEADGSAIEGHLEVGVDGGGVGYHFGLRIFDFGLGGTWVARGREMAMKRLGRLGEFCKREYLSYGVNKRYQLGVIPRLPWIEIGQDTP